MKIDKAERASAKTKKKKWEEIMQEYEEKGENYTQALREVWCAYTYKNDFRIKWKQQYLFQS